VRTTSSEAFPTICDLYTARRAAGAVLAALIWALPGACTGDESIDLTDRFATAETQWETRRIDLGTPGARRHLVAGWGLDELWERTSFVWALGERSAVEFFVATPRPTTLTMRCWPLPFAGVPPQTVQVACNGTAVGSVLLKPGPAEYSVALPATALQPGVNRLDLTYAYARRPSDISPKAPDTRALAAACDWLGFDGLSDARAPALQPASGGTTLALPAGSEVTYFFDLPEGTALELDDVAPLDGSGRADVPCAILAEQEGRPPQVLRAATPSALDAQAWNIDGSGVTKLIFRVGSSADTSGVQARPRLRLPARAATAGVCGDRAAVPRTTRPPVIIYLVDTLRADHLGCYGYPRPTSPRIDAFARDAVRFERALAQAPWTKPAVASIFTGLTPPQHGATGAFSVLGKMPTIAALLAAAGYDTAAFAISGFLDREFGLWQGFGEYRVFVEQPIGPNEGVRPRAGELMHQRADVGQQAALSWLDTRPSTAPLFLYVHVSDPHAPYLAPEPFRQRFAAGVDPQLGLVSNIDAIHSGQRQLATGERDAIIALYDAEVAYTDDRFGAFLDGLAARGLYENALIVLVADHGEAFAEHRYWQHGSSMFDEQIRVPLLIKLPGNRSGGRVVSDVVSQVDILPTALEVAGAAPPAGLAGASLVSAVACGAPLARGRAVYSHLGGTSLTISLEGVMLGNDKLIHDFGTRHTELYDLAADPQERRDLTATRQLRTGYLASLAIPFRLATAAALAAEVEIDPAVRERLRALGYAQ